MNIQKKEENLEEKQIKNSVIDLLHSNKEVTHEATSKATAISIVNI